MNLRHLFLCTLAAFSLYSCAEDTLADPSGSEQEPRVITGDVWEGSTITFTKSPGADPNDAANQDRITDNVWLTRGNNGGQVFNIRAEGNYNKQDSPVGTEWAQGSLDEISSLNFRPFRSAVGSPKDVVGKDLVLYLVDDDIYLSVKFTQWSQNKNGGFTYERSTE
ncbi:MAG TPA: hypothetical protein VJ953_21800 [Saprospiraceae bacterium]|nr:hypothetical protein [Saprospiraceae bacterium]